MVNWEILVPVLKTDLQNFVDGSISGTALYKLAIKKNVGPEVRQLVRPGVDRARKLTRMALRRHSKV